MRANESRRANGGGGEVGIGSDCTNANANGCCASATVNGIANGNASDAVGVQVSRLVDAG